MHSKSQVSFEFFIFVGLAFLMAIAFELASLDQLNDFRLENENAAVKDLALKLQKEVLIAAYVEDGYSRTFEIPNDIYSLDFSLDVRNSTIAVQSKNSFYIVSIPQSVGNFSKGTNTIKKSGNIVYIN